MSGILDNRTRIMDTIVTLEGRRQMADGKLRIEYVSFTDSTTFYDPDVVSGSADATTRLYFEQCHLPQDQITFEADDSGKLKPFKNSQGIAQASSGKIYINYSSSINFDYLTGSQFASTAGSLLNSSISNFKNLQVLGSKDYIFEDDGFEIGPSTISFQIGLESPVSSNKNNRSLQELPSLFNDKNLSRVKNFKYLPPINKINDKTIDRSNPNVILQNKIGNYENLHTEAEYTPINLEKGLLDLQHAGFRKLVKFEPTSLLNNIVAQIFEINGTEIKKLDVIDYGNYQYQGSSKHAYFAGKVLVDANGSQTFVKMFTLVFE